MLVQMPYSGCNSLFIRILLNKKYALPLRVISSLVSHFCGFENETRQLPVLWHHALLVFAQRYKHQLNPEERERLKQLLKIQTHYQITPEIRRELLSTDVSKPDAMVMA
jgi:essential nuclear protein 1